MDGAGLAGAYTSHSKFDRINFYRAAGLFSADKVARLSHHRFGSAA
jgi:hypothetical protein